MTHHPQVIALDQAVYAASGWRPPSMQQTEEPKMKPYERSRAAAQPEQKPKKGNPPIRKINAGCVHASVWENTMKNKEGQDFVANSVSIVRRWKDPEGEWHDSSSFHPNDLPNVVLVVEAALKFLRLDERSPEQ